MSEFTSGSLSLLKDKEMISEFEPITKYFYSRESRTRVIPADP
ncbi:hypothetical protein PAECIP111893_02017 [Paenibacillus plantiphilus]|uniref:Uncharacterized protein n=1 Tax=Paenibacillus plantiphilus TaxID=2905650 RepID=A0ABN8GEU4_9BACL|nr:hypothetical protein [Paenibacillus plantiphilus]CAH1203630.1 hypothetical protein PAECIP111893_02017 [Paenibacillus plantiphilus]